MILCFFLAPWILTHDMIKTLNISIVVSGSNTKFSDDININNLLTDSMKQDPYKVAKEMNIYKAIDSTKFLSTNDVIERIIQNRKTYEKRNTKRSAKEKDYLSNKQYVSEI